MKLFRIFGPVAFALTSVLAAQSAAAAELRVLTHSSFSLPKPLLAQFEKDHGVQLKVVKAGDAGEVLNKLILTKASPIADVVYGLDNTLAPKALAAGVIEPQSSVNIGGKALASLPTGLVSVDYGYVTLNYDKAWFAKSAKVLPKTLQELSDPSWAGLLVVQNPATSSPGYAFLLATVGAMGEEAAFEWWGKMRANGVKVAKGWSEAYYTDFSRNGGRYPLVVSYSTSPAAELFYAKDKPSEPPTATLDLAGGVFRQVEGVALVAGAGERAAAQKFVEFLRSPAVQKSLQTTMWMYPVDSSVAREDVMRFAPEPTQHSAPTDKDLQEKGAAWVARWTKTVLK